MAPSQESPLNTVTPPTGSDVEFVSNSSWAVFDADPASGAANNLGFAQFVCLDSYHPSNCPTGATLYGWPYGGWSADLTSIPRAAWIWAPNVTGQTTPAEYNQFFFSKTFQIDEVSVLGRIVIAVDDFAEVRVNGQIVGGVGSISDYATAVAAQSGLTTLDFSRYLKLGANIITVRAENGPFGSCCPSSYSGNPAGVVFGGSLLFPRLALSPSSGVVGSTIIVQGTGFPNSPSGFSVGPTVEVTFDDQFIGTTSLDSSGSFVFVFSIPLSQPGSHSVKAYDLLGGTNASTTFLVLAQSAQNLSVSIGVGPIYFPGETASFSILVASSGVAIGPAGVNVQLALTLPNNRTLNLNLTSTATGVYRGGYSIPATGALGTYALIAVAHVQGVGDGTALAAFEVKQSWLSANGPGLTAAVAASLIGIVGAVVIVQKHKNTPL